MRAVSQEDFAMQMQQQLGGSGLSEEKINKISNTPWEQNQDDKFVSKAEFSELKDVQRTDTVRKIPPTLLRNIPEYKDLIEQYEASYMAANEEISVLEVTNEKGEQNIMKLTMAQNLKRVKLLS